MNKSILITLVLALVATASCCYAAIELQHIPMKADLRVHPFSSFDTPDFQEVDGATVSIEVNYAPGFDKLFFDYQGAFNISQTWDDKKGTLFLVGEAPISEYLDAISTIVFYTTADDFQARRITWSLGRVTYYNYLTRHFYRFLAISSPWYEAVDACNKNKFLGMQGYLATITSLEEHALISAKANQTMWIALTAQNSSNQPAAQWLWGSGPEMNQVSWTGNSMYEGGVATKGDVEPAYNAWGRFQPEDITAADVNAYFAAYVPSEYENVAFWYNRGNNDGVQGYICEYGGMDNGMYTQQMDQWAGSVILEYSCSEYSSSQTECSNRAGFGCAWTGSDCKQTGCVVHKTEKDCDLDSRCQWNTDITTSMIGVCSATRCATYASQETCEADPGCSFNSFGQCIVATCGSRQSPCACGGLDGCTWNDHSCKYEEALGCDGYDIAFAFDSSSAMDQPFLTFTGGWQGLTSRFINAQYALTKSSAGSPVLSTESGQRVGFIKYGESAQTNPASTGSMGRITGNIDEVMSDLDFMQKSFSPSDSRMLTDALEAADTMLAVNPADATSRKKVLVIFAAGPIGDTTTAASKVASLESKGVIVLGVALRPTQPATKDSMGAWDTLMGLSPNIKVIAAEMDDVTSAAIYGLCSLNSTLGKAISTTNPGAALMCSSNTNNVTCAGNPYCGWSWSTKTCVNSQCLDHCSASECNADSTCAWNSLANACVEACPGQPTLTACNTKFTVCDWNPTIGLCQSLPCLSNPTEDACIADPAGCVYNASALIKCQKPSCSYGSPSACEADWRCKYFPSGAGCQLDPCVLVQNRKDFCELNAKCYWNTNVTNGRCELHKCARYSTEQRCNFDFDCNWDVTVSPSACMPAPCTGVNKDPLTAETKCNMNTTTCKFMAPTGGNPARCEVLQCGMMTRSCDCAKLPQCVWRNDQCKDSIYVQCPAIDVAFLVEGTPVMNKPFGRHPNGLIGIIESIRGWSRDAPMSSTIQGTGFRMGIALYGANTAQTVPSSTGAGNAFTGDSAKWLNEGQALDSILAEATNYAAKAQGNVAISDGLKRIKEMLIQPGSNGTLSAPNRKKMLIVMGNTPITDGGDIVREQIKELEAMGVHIFTNVIRRFSTITPQDWNAASFMRPMASDPESAHFLFTTIDAMRATLLDEFCDPSTNTGRVLQVSRDRTLPCNWLVGQRECNMQATCMWNASALPTCPLPGQCPNLDCAALPAALVGKYDCQHCELSRGAILCSRANTFLPAPGLCVQSPCMNQCTGGVCNATAGCGYNTGSSRCDRDWCSTYSSLSACNDDSGCVWDEFTTVTSIVATTGRCRASRCWTQRSANSCGTPTTTDAGGIRPTCIWDSQFSPAVCEERRCDQLDTAACDAQPVQCIPDLGASGRKCSHRTCAYDRGDQCETDGNCYWNPYELHCRPRTPDCIISKDFSPWSKCTASCGKAIRYRYRRIVQFPDPVIGRRCDLVLTDFAPGEQDMVQVENCHDIASWPMDCALHCTNYSSNTAVDINQRLRDCMADDSCQWQAGNCLAKDRHTCEMRSRTNKTDCELSDLCVYNDQLNFCQSGVRQCQFTGSGECKKISWQCSWRTGSTARNLASGMGLDDITLFNPGQPPVFVFPSLFTDSTVAASTYIQSASVMIETAYQRGKDVLALSLPTPKLTNVFYPAQGLLVIMGNATVAEYYDAIKFVTFETTATSTNPRHITWALGTNTVLSATTGHRYTFFNSIGITWQDADTKCNRMRSHGQQGYLATITSDGEGAVISSKLLATGWLGADNAKSGVWQWIRGPEAGQSFWQGGNVLFGGTPFPNQFADWTPEDEPREGPIGQMRLYLNATGYWASRKSDFASEDGYICEFGGMTGDTLPAYQVGGSTVFGVGGCLPNTCMWHATTDLCRADPDCEFNGFSCVAGCASRSTASECGSSSRCFWDTEVLPPVCSRNPCAGLGSTVCRSNPRCKFDTVGGECILESGCRAIETQDSCNGQVLCQWFADTTDPTKGQCTDKPCSAFGDANGCARNPTCEFVAGTCVTTLCKYPDRAQCDKHQKDCYYASANATGSKPFTPNVNAIKPFDDNTIIPPRDASSDVDGITVRISEGFQINQDELFIIEDSDTGSVFESYNFDASSGALIALFPKSSKTDPVTAFNVIRRTVSFRTSSTRSVVRTLEYTIGFKAFFSKRNTAFVKVINTDKPLATYSEAMNFCANARMFGTNGMLATPNNLDDSVALAAVDAQGWIGAQALGGSGTWNWNYGNGTLDHFWTVRNGAGQPVPANPGQSPIVYKFAQWSSGQPLAPPANTDQYGFFNSFGKWMSVTNNHPNTPRGVICSFPVTNVTKNLNMFGILSIAPEGCFALPCKGQLEGPCKSNPQCVWDSFTSKCSIDSFCGVETGPTGCNRKHLCFFDYTRGICRVYADATCGTRPAVAPADDPEAPTCSNGDGQCEWNQNLITRAGQLGACVSSGCGVNPVQLTCEANPVCRWFQRTGSPVGVCIDKLCGYLDSESCWKDAKCIWNTTTDKCMKSICLTTNNCAAEPSCSLGAGGACTWVRCSSRIPIAKPNDPKCLFDPSCLVVSSQCTQPNCARHTDAGSCNKDAQCYYFTSLTGDEPSYCGAAQCTNNPDSTSCGGANPTDPCRWTGSSCRQASPEEMTSEGIEQCIKEVDPNMWWLWFLLVLILIVLGLIIWRLYLAYAKGLSFLDPPRKNIKFDAARQFAAELFEEAQNTGDEANYDGGDQGTYSPANGEDEYQEEGATLDEL